MHFTPGVVAPVDGGSDKVWMIYQGARILVCDALPEPSFPELKDAGWLGMPEVSRHFVGYWMEKEVYAVATHDDAVAPEGYRFEDLRRVLGHISDELFAVAGRALQILEWDVSHRFCGRCGAGTLPHARGERAKVCSVCNTSFYPRINPCMIVLVTRGEELLLARAQRFNRPMFSTLAGFVEAGESVEETLVREVREEVGVEVRNARYFSSQSWPFPGNLMLGFHAEYAGGDIIVQEDEIAEARFFHYRDLPQIPPRGSIAHSLIHDFVMRCHKIC